MLFGKHTQEGGGRIIRKRLSQKSENQTHLEKEEL